MQRPDSENKKYPSILGGAMIVAGTAVGAGMFSLPVAAAGMWFGYSVLMLVAVWFCMVTGGLLLLEANLHYEAGVSFDSLTSRILGSFWRVVSGVSVVFLLYILTYAYVSGGGSIVNHSLSVIDIAFSEQAAALIFALVLATAVVTGTRHVSRISTVMLGGMVITFLLAVSGLMAEVKPAKLWMPDGQQEYAPYILAALPVGLASFGYQGVIPSLVKFYDKSTAHVVRAVLAGTLLALAIYVSWLIVTMGNIHRSAFSDIIAQGGNIGALVAGLGSGISEDSLNHLLTLFANLAVASSFLGVTLGLFDYLADLFGLDDSWPGRVKTGFVTFTPPTVLGVLYPDGFIWAIGYAALAGAVSVAVIPAIMAMKVRTMFPDNRGFKVAGGAFTPMLVLAFGITVIVCHILNLLNLLPVFK